MLLTSRRRSRVSALAGALILAASLGACSIESLVGEFNLCEGVGPVTSVSVSPTQVSLRAGDSVTVVASQLDSKGHDTFLCTAQDIAWSTAHPTIAGVSGDRLSGKIVGVAPGQTTIGLVAVGRSAAVSVTVTPR